MNRLAYGLRAKDRLIWAVIGLLLVGAVILGYRTSMRWLMLIGAVFAGIILIILTEEPRLGLLGLIAVTLVLPVEINTGTEVSLNIATLFVPTLFVLLLIGNIRKHEFYWSASRVNPPLMLFVLAGLLSLLLGNALWDPTIPKSDNFWLVQLAQWGIFVFAAMAFWLGSNLHSAKIWLPRLIWFFLYLGGGLAILWILPFIGKWVTYFTTKTLIRAPFWVLLIALAGGQLLFNPALGKGRRVFLLTVIAAVFYYAFILHRESASNWVGVAAVVSTLIWLCLPKVRGVIIVLIVILALTGTLFPSLYEFAGGDAEWQESGASRLLLIRHVIQVTLRNPVTGLGPASYRVYANNTPFRFNDRIWVGAVISSHNNYVDLFAHTGLLGLGLFLWFAVELGLLGWRLSQQHQEGFVGGYVNGMTAAWIGSLVIMLLADWILPFVYNIGFPGFQASILVWMFLGGVVSVASNEEKYVQNP